MEKSYYEEYIDKYIKLIPPSIMNRYDGTITFTSRPINSKMTGMMLEDADCITGIYLRRNHNIIVNINYPESVIHEMGHFVDFELLPNRKGFNPIFDIEKDLGNLDEYFTSSRKEFFAEMFKLVVLKDREIENYPLARDYMILLIKKI